MGGVNNTRKRTIAAINHGMHHKKQNNNQQKQSKKLPCSSLEIIKVVGELLSSQNLVLYSCRWEETLVDLNERDQKEYFVTKEKEAQNN